MRSSQIEGTQATLVDLLTYETDNDGDDATPRDPDVEEICNYLAALSFGRQQLSDPAGLPLSMGLLNAAHTRLMQGVRGAEKLPGEVRRSQNWLGKSRPGNAGYVPPPPYALPGALSNFEKYIHAQDAMRALLRAGLLHVQFETIHPYLDGNGRIGRLLVTLLLEHWKLLTKPLLYLSLYFKRHRSENYRRLNAVRLAGEWEAWLDFFLDAVTTIADEAAVSGRHPHALVALDRDRVLGHEGATIVSLRLFEWLPTHPIVTIAFVMKRLMISKPTAGRAIEALDRAGILAELTGRRRDRSWAYQHYLDQLRVGTELEVPDRPGRRRR
ncbi:MAG: Fic family protein [Deltaproteobacteria bacterium]|nr:MAG: Fic family protein [Deltaproteobacteria bacterium]